MHAATALDRHGFHTPAPALPLLQIEEDPTGGKLAAQMGKLGGAPHKLDNSIQFHVGDTITALARATMQPGGSEVLLYGTIMGGVGAFFPFQAKEVSGSQAAGDMQGEGHECTQQRAAGHPCILAGPQGWCVLCRAMRVPRQYAGAIFQ
jgi:hypothetical protein